MRQQKFVAELFRSIAVVGLFALVAGCGSGTQPVTGTVTYKSSPLSKGTITFVPETGRPSSGEIADGKILNVTTNHPNDGLPKGKYKVAIAAMDKPGEMSAKWIIPERYGDAAKSGLQAEIKDGENRLSFDLKN